MCETEDVILHDMVKIGWTYLCKGFIGPHPRHIGAMSSPMSLSLCHSRVIRNVPLSGYDQSSSKPPFESLLRDGDDTKSY